jgi:hypothetical protein
MAAERPASTRQHDTRQGTLNLQMAAIVGNEAKLPELVHERTDARSRRSDDLGQRSLVDLHRDGLWNGFFAELRNNEKHSRETTFARIVRSRSAARSSRASGSLRRILGDEGLLGRPRASLSRIRQAGVA